MGSHTSTFRRVTRARIDPSRISNGFVLIGRESGEKGAQSQSQSHSQIPNPNPKSQSQIPIPIPIPIPIWREYERHKHRSPGLETFATEQQPDSRTTRQKDGGEEDVDREQGDGEGRQHRHRPRERPQPDRQAPPQCQEDADAFGGKTERKRKKPSERGERRV